MLVLIRCSGAATGAASPDGGDGDGTTTSGGTEIPITPEKKGQPALSADEKKEMGATCNLIEPDHYDAGKKGLAALAAELDGGTASEAAEQKALTAALAHMEGKDGGLDGADVKRCNELFAKQLKGRLFAFEPAEEEARGTVSSCVKRVESVFGKDSMVVNMGGSGDAASHGPFCPDDFPVPASLADLPYKSSSDDWDTTTWKCLQFGLRVEQKVQLEYLSPRGSGEFHCIARFLPRQGGAPIELVRGGKVDEEGTLLIGEKTQRRRMK